MHDDCKCGNQCDCHGEGEAGGVKDIPGEGGKVPFVKECKCGGKCKKDKNDLDEE